MASSTPKTMSSRLMTMKFMQRSVAKAPSPTTKSSTSVPSTPRNSNGVPSSKRVRLSHGGAAAPSTPSDAELLTHALEVEERKREEAVAKAAEKAGESKWVFSVNEGDFKAREREGLRVEYAGFAVIDGDDLDDGEDEVESGEEVGEEEEGDAGARNARFSFGGGVKKKVQAKKVYGDSEEEGEVSDDSDGSENSNMDSDDSSDDDDPASELIRETRREVASQAKAEKRAPQNDRKTDTPRRNMIVDEDASLRGLTSLSGRGGAGGRGAANMECFSCGKKGHSKSQCPNISCHGCGKKGHFQGECPNKRQSGGPRRISSGGGNGGGGGGGFGGGRGRGAGFVRF